MKIDKFVSGKYQRGDRYTFFLPEKINHPLTLTDSSINSRLESSSFRLGELNSYADLVPDIDMFIRSHIMKEAVTSSQIEGTRTGMEGAFTDELDINPELRSDWHEVNQYVKAMNYAIRRLQKLPLSNRLLKDTHKILLAQVRGRHKSPGEFRRSQNWIGGTRLENAVFIPPHHEHVPDLMSDLEKFLHNEKIKIPRLIKIAVAHYQFETIHPFLDGNGRIGRLLITLYLISNGILTKPLLYLSDFFATHRRTYFEKLSLARDQNQMTGWVTFFLEAVKETSGKAIGTLKEIIRLKEKIEKRKIITLGRRITSGQLLLDRLFSDPVITSKKAREMVNLSLKATNDLINAFRKLKILKEVTGFKRNRLFVFRDYLKILNR